MWHFLCFGRKCHKQSQSFVSFTGRSYRRTSSWRSVPRDVFQSVLGHFFSLPFFPSSGLGIVVLCPQSLRTRSRRTLFVFVSVADVVACTSPSFGYANAVSSYFVRLLFPLDFVSSYVVLSILLDVVPYTSSLSSSLSLSSDQSPRRKKGKRRERRTKSREREMR